jgi:hypothetical protein
MAANQRRILNRLGIAPLADQPQQEGQRLGIGGELVAQAAQIESRMPRHRLFTSAVNASRGQRRRGVRRGKSLDQPVRGAGG